MLIDFISSTYSGGVFGGALSCVSIAANDCPIVVILSHITFECPSDNTYQKNIQTVPKANTAPAIGNASAYAA